MCSTAGCGFSDTSREAYCGCWRTTTIAVRNLKKEASARGIDPDRLVFAPRMALPDHLARHRMADLFLDTLPYNAHTTASDALWTGLPVLTQIGETFAGRVAASLLNAVGLPELITTTRDAYEALAIELATNPAKLASIKQKLSDNRLNDAAVRHRAVHQAYRSGIHGDVRAPSSRICRPTIFTFRNRARGAVVHRWRRRTLTPLRAPASAGKRPRRACPPSSCS